MNAGILPFPSHQPLPQVRAYLKLDGTGVTMDGIGPTAGRNYSQSAIKAAFNIERVVYNGAGDFTVHFITPMPDPHFMVMGLGNSTGGGDYPFIAIDPSDLGLADRKRIQVATDGTTETNYAQVHLVFIA